MNRFSTHLTAVMLLIGSGAALGRAATGPAAAEVEPALIIPPEEWRQLGERILNHGDDFGHDGVVVRAIEHTVGEKDEDHTSDYIGFSDWVSERWTTRRDGRWNIDQWLFRHGMRGELQSCIHQIQTADRLERTGLGVQFNVLSKECDAAAIEKHGALKRFGLNYTRPAVRPCDKARCVPA
ncbi:MAG: hypothetical protein HY078_01895 [Elusimicrobia bacterium]|nr:hypothetical protein [Elusimicrobiota bacterium]